mmetsp:Transcript_14914/g.39974  ORF Transcript_14914/g.39974 Transcript_14914/m.39974 type:complete len:295 (+) Transcript_14914:141-1025(+)
MCVAEDVHQLTWTQSGDVGHHDGQKRVTRNIERNAEAQIARALVHLARQLAVCHVELKKHVARRQCHLRDGVRVPCGHHHPSVVWIVLDGLNHLRKLVYTAAAIIRIAALVLGAEMTPLKAVYGPKIALPARVKAHFVEKGARAVAVPYMDAAFLQRGGVGVAAHKPEHFFGDAAPEHALGGEQREATAAQVKTHLRAKQRQRAGARAVSFTHALREDAPHKLEVLLLLRIATCRGRAWRVEIRRSALDVKCGCGCCGRRASSKAHKLCARSVVVDGLIDGGELEAAFDELSFV